MEQGKSSEGDQYSDIQQMWNESLKEDWYQKSIEYWQNSTPDISGMLGGFPETHVPDIDCSRRFLELLFANFQVKQSKCIEIGAGIGRVIKSLMVNHFQTIDMMEQNPIYVEEAKKQLAEFTCMRNFEASSAQNYQFVDKYDVIWVQWISQYLPDQDLLQFLQKCQQALTETGVIVIKENLAREGFYFDKQDNSIMRSLNNYMQLFKQAGLNVQTSMNQDNWDEDLFPVILVALR